MDNKNFTIGILSTTAVILLVGLLLVQTRPEPAYGFGMNAQGGDYVLITGQLQRNEEILYVIDAASQKMIAYRFDINSNTIQVGDAENLAKLKGGDDAAAGSPRTGKGRGRSRRR